jgi:F-type H+-transporting ATPase subunit delta
MLRASRRLYSSSVVRMAAPAATTGASLVLNLCTPHTAIYTKKSIDKVILPGETGEYGVTIGHSPLISQLKPGVVSVIHVGVRKYSF